MTPFDIEKEAEYLAHSIYGVPLSSIELRQKFVALLNRAIKATEEECIKITCDLCAIGDEPVPVPSKDGENWRHTCEDFTLHCFSAAIHERRRQRREGK